MSEKKHTIGLIGLVFGLLALGLAVLPGIIFDQPPQNPFAPSATSAHASYSPAPASSVPEGPPAVKLQYKSWSLGFGRKKKVADEQNVADEQKAAALPKQPDASELAAITKKERMKWFSVAMVVTALIGVGFSVFARAREPRWSLPASGVSCCCTALTWQYFVVGICAGAAAAAFLIVLSKLDFGA